MFSSSSFLPLTKEVVSVAFGAIFALPSFLSLKRVRNSKMWWMEGTQNYKKDSLQISPSRKWRKKMLSLFVMCGWKVPSRSRQQFRTKMDGCDRFERERDERMMTPPPPAAAAGSPCSGAALDPPYFHLRGGQQEKRKRVEIIWKGI
jgi:hypothetical protein